MAEIKDYQKIAKILRTNPAVMEKLETWLRPGIFEDVLEENQELMKARLTELGLNHDCASTEIYDALISKVEADDVALLQITGREAGKVCDYVKTLHPPAAGFFIKKEKARELLLAEPPRKVIMALEYSRVEDLLAQEDLLEVFAALRFLEDRDWLNNVFFKQYEKLTPADFEDRLIEFRPLPQKWADAAEKFVSKKYHNVSHLKELGVIFIIPLFLGISGETLRLLSLLLHYLYEIEYYSDLFRRSAGQPNFAQNLISLLRGDVPALNQLPASSNQPPVMVIQRYLAKEDENDPRLFMPHINPEALHWQKATKELDLPFWQNLDWVGEQDLSFNLVDTVMSLVMEREMVKYLYHHQEALWNKIFIEHFGAEQVEELSKKNIIGGYFNL